MGSPEFGLNSCAPPGRRIAKRTVFPGATIATALPGREPAEEQGREPAEEPGRDPAEEFNANLPGLKGDNYSQLPRNRGSTFYLPST